MQSFGRLPCIERETPPDFQVPNLTGILHHTISVSGPAQGDAMRQLYALAQTLHAARAILACWLPRDLDHSLHLPLPPYAVPLVFTTALRILGDLDFPAILTSGGGRYPQCC